MDFGFPELNDNDHDNQNEYTITKSNPTNLHLARMPENFKRNLGTNSAPKDSTKVNRNLVVKKQRITETESKETHQFIMEDLDEMKKTEDHGNQPTRYIGREITQNQRYLVFYRKEREIMLCGLSSTVSFKKDQQLKSAALENIKGKRGGRQVGIKSILRTTAKKEEDEKKEKEKEKEGAGKGDDDDNSSTKSWSDGDDSDSDNEQKGAGRSKKKDTMVIKNIFEQQEAAPEPPKKAAPKEKGTATAKATTEKEGSENPSATDQKDSDNDSDSSLDFE